MGGHVGVVVGLAEVVDRLEFQRELAAGGQVAAVELGLGHGLDGFLHEFGDLLEYLGPGAVDHAGLEDDAALGEVLVIADARAEQVGVGDHHYLAGQAADAGGFEADMLDGAGDGVGDYEVAHGER